MSKRVMIRLVIYLELALLVSANFVSYAAASSNSVCVRIAIRGEVSQGGQWAAALGEGWAFRILPIAPASAGYSGWDLVVDREPPAGFPDALLLATLPYNSINEREIGTTFGLRAQDAIGWNPRSFHFISSPAEFREAQQLFPVIAANMRSAQSKANSTNSSTQSVARLLEIQKHAATGEFRILDARIIPGIADPAPYAQGWALAASRTPHEVEDLPAGGSTVRGALKWMRFSLTLWLPASWNAPSSLAKERSACPQ